VLVLWSWLCPADVVQKGGQFGEKGIHSLGTRQDPDRPANPVGMGPAVRSLLTRF
jgi:hypothetical protein